MRNPSVVLSQPDVDYAVVSAAIDFRNEVDRALWRVHVMSMHSASWRKAWDEKSSEVG